MTTTESVECELCTCSNSSSSHYITNALVAVSAAAGFGEMLRYPWNVLGRAHNHSPPSCPVIFLINTFPVVVIVARAAPQHDDYSDSLAREKFFPLAAAAYSPSPQDCIGNKYKNASVGAVFVKRCQREQP